ncbi:hypothetical protein [Endozoicomonas sp. GU-1]|uniref:hypothetical protein n=1 Tax=Endozoicomonas sp. GU-1 TaxID=3009078 RepID=UPI0022B43F8C|nr:hypothetical protein [Endozoicomonas sp. GU-1]WBA82471.1 hypothetical protein O2T12_04800 [Endozoicomonas sp. GU-1]WBA85404.1 hypothetical protein O3276_19475 [Endozoicomonas sp. GU-1]
MFQLAQIITGKSEKDLFTVLALKADIILAVTLTMAVLQQAITGMATSWMLLLVGSLFSIIVLTGLDKGARKALAGIPSYIPYVFGIYLFFVEGFGRLTQLVTSFSIVNAALVILFFVAGNVVATVGYNAVVYARRLEQSH